MSILRQFAVLLALGLLAPAARADFVTVRGNAARAANRVDVVFVGDGYTAADHAAGTYATHVDDYVGYMFGGGRLAEPFGRYANFFNVHRVTVISNESGADEPNAEGGPISRDTALDASFGWNGAVDRLLYFDTGKANAAMNGALAGSGIDVDMRLGVVNTAKYGGGGGSWGVWSGGNGSSREIGLHELGHSFGRLADEYAYTAGTVYTGGELGEANASINGNVDDPGHKWARWMGFDDGTNLGPVGAFEGGRYFQEGIFRPTDNSKMRSLGRAFDAVSREALILKIYENLDPLDSWTDTADVVTNAALEVLRVDPGVIALEWFVDGSLVAGATAGLFDLRDWGFGPGVYDVTVRAFDPFGFDVAGVGLQNRDWWVRAGSENLEQFVSWNVSVAAVPEPGTWGLLLLAAGGAAARRRASRRRVGGAAGAAAH